MLNKIIDFSLRNRLTVIVLAIVLLTAGAVVLVRTEVDIFPDLNAPTVVVMTEAPGMAAEDVEKLVSYPIETSVNGSTGVRRVRSSSASGFSVVWVEFDWDTDVYLARQIVSERLTEAASQMPAGVGTPTLGPQSSILGEIMIIGLSADSTSLLDVRTLADRTIRPQLKSIPGVSQVSVIGGDIKEYQIHVSPERLKHFGLSMSEVEAALENVNDNASGGVFYEYGNEYIIKGDINTTDPVALGKAVVRSGVDGSVLVEDIAEVCVGSKLPRIGVASVAARPAVIMTVTKQPGAGTISLTQKIDAELEKLARTLPSDVKVSTDIFRQSDFIESSISNLQESLLEGAVFVIIVLFFFLMNLRTTLISLVALPMSVIIAVLVLHSMGYTINTMSLGGIAIAIGSLVDDAIVDVENVFKRLKENHALPSGKRKSVIDVVYHASAEVRMPIFNSSLIIIASFLPLFFLSGIEGRMLIPLGVSFIVALIASTVVALTVTPVLCSFLLGSKKATSALNRTPRPAQWLRGVYDRALKSALMHKKMILSCTGLLFVLAVCLMFTLGRSFLPGFNEGSLTINVSTLPGISLEESDAIGREAERIILEIPEVQTVARKTGRAELDEHSLGVNTSEIEAPYKLGGRSRSEMVAELREKLSQIPGSAIEIGQPISHRIDAMLSGTEAQIAIKLFGDDLNRLYSIGSQIKKLVQATPGMADVNIEQQVERPQLEIRPRRDMLAFYGIKMSEFNTFVSTALGGKVVSEVYEDGLPYDITLRLDDEHRGSMEAIRDMLVDSDRGKIPLSYVADVVSASGPNTINRENVKRRIVISANLADGDLRSAVNSIRRSIDDNIQLPEGYYVTYGGQFESEAEASRILTWATLGALIIILMLLYHEFKNIGQSFIILINMPLAMIGGVFILRFTSGELNIPAIIGFISLLGITTRNGMLLVSRYNHLQIEGMGLQERIMTGSSDRLLPIVMTALTSALALIPLALRSSQPGNEIQSPLAVVILGGLISSTVLNVFIVPILYQISQTRKSNIK